MEASVLMDKWRSLNPANQKQAADFVDFLLIRQQKEAQALPNNKQAIHLGVWKDMPCYISDDFDDPLDDFKEYM